MKFFAGIVPPVAVSNAIAAIQSGFGNNRLEPHITLRPPVTPANKSEWLLMVEETASKFPTFNVRLTGTGNFGSRVLYISVESPPLIELQKLLVSALKPFEPVEIQKHNEGYHPHLTLGRAWCGFTPAHFAAMRPLTADYLQNGIEFEVRFIRIYHKPDAQKGYQTYQDVPLG